MSGKAKLIALAGALILLSLLFPSLPAAAVSPAREEAPAAGPRPPRPLAGADWGASVLRLGGSVLLVLVLAGGSVLVLSRLQRPGARAAGRRALALVETLPLGGRKRLHLARVEGRLLVLGETEKEVSLLLDLGAAEEPAAAPAGAEAPPRPALSFRRLLRSRAGGEGGR